MYLILNNSNNLKIILKKDKKNKIYIYRLLIINY